MLNKLITNKKLIADKFQIKKIRLYTKMSANDKMASLTHVDTITHEDHIP